ncbi:MAG: hypothetical protein JWQ49_1766 [Edaphobacter sp.]|nr:hypothetical protein [Edaphobacter sp.]
MLRLRRDLGYAVLMSVQLAVSRQKVVSYLLFFSFSLPALGAKDRPPLPAEIKTAKSIYLDNESGIAIVADYAYRELKKWNRFEITDSPDKADLIFVFTGSDERSTSTGMANGKPITMTGGPCHATLVVRSSKNHDQSLWQDTKNCSWHGASADLIRELKKRMEDH